MAAPRAMFGSEGKDSVLAIHRRRRGGACEGAELMTSINPGFGQLWFLDLLPKA